ncbi:hypothetical protein Tco_1407062 [Tanacetum coccineum]
MTTLKLPSLIATDNSKGDDTTLSCYMSFSFFGVPIGIVSIFHCCSLCFSATVNTVRNQVSDGRLGVMASASDVDILLGGILST